MSFIEVSRMDYNFLYEFYNTLDKIEKQKFRKKIPDYIVGNLKYSLRPYQEEAVNRYLYHYSCEASSREQILFNMATGSGKTLLMAAIILEKYKQGERNFIFFVNNDNILTKTRSNFVDSGNEKYLFADKIVIDNQVVNVREVTDFSDAQSDAINIVFTTIQKLHLDLNTPRENRLSYEQFEGLSVVLLADEAHHLNAGLSKGEKDDNTSWTSTIENIQKRAARSSIFEFTATIDLSNKDIAEKYKDSLIFKYDLKEFRLDKYSKDVLFHLVDGNLKVRMLNAILISQYRKKIALKNGVNLKPLVMFKSEKIADNKGNMELFQEMLSELTPEMILEQKEMIQINTDTKVNVLQKALDFFEASELSLFDLISELQEDFREERLLLIDGKNKNSNHLVTLNTLELPSNEIRAIFAVDMLNEGWDVLNLFDIVRLYDKRDGKTTETGFQAGKTTNAEKQLIGRGARYYPFVIDGKVEEKYTRKFDENENNELRVIEQLHYHSANNPRYIYEMKQVLRESGIYDDQNMVERELKLKESFKRTRTYTDGVVWMNKRLSYEEVVKSRQGSLFDTTFVPDSIEVSFPSNSIFEIDAFGDDNDSTPINNPNEFFFKFGKVIDMHIVRHAMNRNKNFTFDKIRKAIVGISSVSGFIDKLSNVEVQYKGCAKNKDMLNQDEKLVIAEKLLREMENSLLPMEQRYFGSDTFEAYSIREIFEDDIIRRYTINKHNNKEFGHSQKNPNDTQYYANIDALEWYAYDDNFGTDEEKLLVTTLKPLINELEEKWSDIYLLRNEKAVRIYNFEDGKAFEPDFLLFANDKRSENTSWQIFIEPKGDGSFDSEGGFDKGKEGWKQRFLNEITKRSDAKMLIDNDNYRIVGLPFFNNKISRDKIKTILRDL
ncbi:MAG: DEAD/DEAH box helicase family protein [Candidatus Nanogingivalaceae bacterium]|nr:MAG: DEAD/DEAH box helicase family protein [Candidatus Nanogingivalaceae bacterium]